MLLGRAEGREKDRLPSRTRSPKRMLRVGRVVHLLLAIGWVEQPRSRASERGAARPRADVPAEGTARPFAVADA